MNYETIRNDDRDFKGVWIPKEIYLNRQLSWTEKILLIEIDSLDKNNGCFASNRYFAQFLGIKENTASIAIGKLKRLGLVTQRSFNGRVRTLQAHIHQTQPLILVKGSKAEKSKADFGETQSILIQPNKTVIKDNGLSDDNLRRATHDTATEARIADFMEYFNTQMIGRQIPKIACIRNRRRAALLARAREYGFDALYQMAQMAAASNFLNGGGDRAFVADIDWLLRPNNFTKVIEGNYNNRTKPTCNDNNTTPRSLSSIERKRHEDREHLQSLAERLPDVVREANAKRAQYERTNPIP